MPDKAEITGSKPMLIEMYIMLLSPVLANKTMFFREIEYKQYYTCTDSLLGLPRR